MSITARRVFVYTWLFVVSACGVEGPQGPAGPQGPKGDPGIQGPSGTNGSGLVNMTACEGVRTLVGNFSVLPRHTVYRFADGSVLATCSIDDTVSEYGATQMYKASQAGSQTGGCFVTYDVGTTRSAGFWQFSLGGATSTAAYTDNGDLANGTRLSLPCTTY